MVVEILIVALTVVFAAHLSQPIITSRITLYQSRRRAMSNDSNDFYKASIGAADNFMSPLLSGGVPQN